MDTKIDGCPTVCFFGHHDCPDSVKPLIRKKIMEVYEKCPDTLFYIGNQGRFDALVLSVFKDMLREGMEPDFCVVLAYHPDKSNIPDVALEYTLYPEGIERVPKRFAISWRNKWLVQQSDMVVCYIRHWHGGAAKYVQLSQRLGKKVINLATK